MIDDRGDMKDRLHCRKTRTSTAGMPSTRTWEGVSAIRCARIGFGFLGLLLSSLGCDQGARQEHETQQGSRSKDWVQAGREGHTERGQEERAIEVLQRAASLAPEDKEVWRRLGKGYLSAGRRTEALGALERAVALDTAYAEAYHDLAALYVDQGQYEKARAMLERYHSLIHLEDQPGKGQMPQAHLLQQHLLRGEVEEAARLAEQIAAQAPHDPRAAAAHNIIGFAFAEQKRWNEAEQAFQKALAVDPHYARAHHALGNIYAAQGQLGKAARAYKAAIADDASLRDAYYGLGSVYAKQEQLDAAIAQFEEVVNLDSVVETGF